MNRIILKIFLFFLLLTSLITSPILAQKEVPIDYSGIWTYDVKETPYGEFTGTFSLSKKEDTYEGKIYNSEGKEFDLTIVRFRGNRMTIQSNIEEANSTFSGFFDGNTFVARGEIEGDDFIYKLVAKRKTDANSK